MAKDMWLITIVLAGVVVIGTLTIIAIIIHDMFRDDV